MVRRKNSAEMLDVLRRVAQEEKARRLRQAQKEEEAASHREPPHGATPTPLFSPPEEARFSPPAGRGRVLPPADGFPEEQAAEVPPPGRFRKTFLSVLSGGRRGGLEAVLTPPDPPEGAAVSIPPRPPEGALAAAASYPSGAAPSPVGLPGGTVPEVEMNAAAAPSPPSPPEGAVAGTVLTPPEGAYAIAHPTGRAVVVSPPKAVDWTPGPPERRATPPARPLFGEPADEGGLRAFLSRAARAFWGDGISGGLRQRVEVKVATIGVYAAVALAAMLAVALIMNQGGGDRREKLLPNSATDQEGVDDATPASTLPVETLPAGRGPGPEVRHIMASPPEGTPAGDGGAPPPQQPKPGATPGTEVPPAAPAAPEEKVFTEVEGPAGWYVQIQSMVRPEHADLMVDHVKALGFRSIWKRPMVNTQEKQQKGKPVQRWFLLRLGPYSSKDEAVKEKGRFLQAIGENPLKNPKKLNWDPFPLKYP